MEKEITVILTPAEEGCTAGAFLKNQIKLSAAQIRSLKFQENGIRINGKRVRVTQVLHAGERLELCLEKTDSSQMHLVPVEHPLDILYEDEDVIGVWKEAGMVMHPAHGHYSDTLTNYLQAYFLKKGEQVLPRSIGRLDADTSGIVVYAKNKIAAARLWQQRQNGTFQKEYIALCEGSFSSGAYEREQTIEVPIQKMPGHKNKMCVVQQACTGSKCPAGEVQCAVTHYRAVSKEEPYFVNAMQVLTDKEYGTAKKAEEGVRRAAGMKDATLVCMHLETGRTHQIRVHMAHIGHPLVGDAVYGHGTPGQTRAKLCAWKAQLLQPFTGEKLLLQLAK